MSDTVISATNTLREAVITNQSQPTIVQSETINTVVVSGGAQGPQGIPGESAALTNALAAINLSGHRGIVLNSSGQALYADNNTPAHASKFVGITQGAVVAGSNATIQRFGEITEPSWSWTPDQPVYLGANGLITQTMPTAASAKFSLIIGVAQTATKIYLNPMPPIFII